MKEEENLQKSPYDLKLVNDDATPIADIVEQLVDFAVRKIDNLKIDELMD